MNQNQVEKRNRSLTAFCKDWGIEDYSAVKQWLIYNQYITGDGKILPKGKALGLSFAINPHTGQKNSYITYSFDAQKRLAANIDKILEKAEKKVIDKSAVYELILKGQKIEEIAEKCKCSESTVERIILGYIQNGIIPYTMFVSEEEKDYILSSTELIENWEKEKRLKPLKELLGDEISYFKIRVAII